LALLAIFGSFVVLLLAGLPVAFSFMLVNLIGVAFYWGGEAGLFLLIRSIFDSVTVFTLIPVPLFVLMGELLFHSGMGARLLDVLDKWLGRLPGRLALLAVGAGTMVSTLSGSSMASTAMLGSVLVPEMERRGYKKPMAIGPILGSGGLAMIIPPTSLGVLLASLAYISVAELLISGIIPGLVIAALYGGYIIIRCWLQPSIAPPYKVIPAPLSEKMISTAKYVLPLGSVIFLVLGLIMLGVASPSESAAMGVVGCFVLAALYRRLNLEVVKKSVNGAIQTTIMVFMILSGSMAFSRILAFSGASTGLIELAVDLPLPPIMLMISMQVGLLVLGMFMDGVSMMMITIPIYMPIILALGLNPVWFGILMLINIEAGSKTPPFGLLLFVMKGVAPPDTTMGDIIWAALPFLLCEFLAMGLIVAFPVLALWLPGLMR